MYTISPQAMAILVALYNSPQRHFHDLNHINFSLAKLSEYIANSLYNVKVEKDILMHSIWFHDSVYSPYPFKGKYSNEKESAELFTSCLREGIITLPSWDVDHGYIFEDAVNQAIRATEHHLDNNCGVAPEHAYTTTYVMMDIDMAGFAKPFDEVYKDSDRIFKEYECLGLPKSVMLQNRINFLKAILAKESIYYTDYFKNTHEYQARANIEAVIELSYLDLKNME